MRLRARLTTGPVTVYRDFTITIINPCISAVLVLSPIPDTRYDIRDPPQNIIFSFTTDQQTTVCGIVVYEAYYTGGGTLDSSLFILN